jgi:hypothetical protein
LAIRAGDGDDLKAGYTLAAAAPWARSSRFAFDLRFAL